MAEEINTPAPQVGNADAAAFNPVTGGVFKLIAQDGKKDRAFHAYEYENGVWTTKGFGGVVLNHDHFLVAPKIWMGAGLVERLEQNRDARDSDDPAGSNSVLESSLDEDQ